MTLDSVARNEHTGGGPPHAPLPDLAQLVQGKTSGLASRLAANVIDLGLTFVVLIGIYLVAAAVLFFWNPRGFSFPAPSLALVIITGSAVAGLYFAIAWMTTGRTYGDYVLGLRVVDRRGGRVHFLPAVLRALTCVVCPIGLFWVVIDRRNRSLQDLLLLTRVVYDWPLAH